jgi:hypothetical protein
MESPSSSSGQRQSAGQSVFPKRRRGSVKPWPGRFQEFQERFAAQHPNGVLDPDFRVAESWATKVVSGPGARISGQCRDCGARFNHTPTDLLREE